MIFFKRNNNKSKQNLINLSKNTVFKLKDKLITRKNNCLSKIIRVANFLKKVRNEKSFR